MRRLQAVRVMTFNLCARNATTSFNARTRQLAGSSDDKCHWPRGRLASLQTLYLLAADDHFVLLDCCSRRRRKPRPLRARWFSHYFDDGDIVMLGFASVFPSTLCWSAREAGH